MIDNMTTVVFDRAASWGAPMRQPRAGDHVTVLDPSTGAVKASGKLVNLAVYLGRDWVDRITVIELR